MSDNATPFNRHLLRKRRNRAAAGFGQYDFLLQNVLERLGDRLEDITRPFPTTLVLGCHGGQVAAALEGRYGIEHLMQCDVSEAMVRRAHKDTAPGFVADEELLPLAPRSLDAVISPLTLHWVNDLPGCLTQIHQALKPDGLFMGAFWGGETLKELRSVLSETEAELSGGIRPRIAPFADVRDAGGLLQRTGFALPIVDRDTITVRYEHLFALMVDLRGMAETNALNQQAKHASSRGLFMQTTECYQQRFGGEDGRIPATFELITLVGWVPHASQPKAAKRGSGEVNLNSILGQ